MSSFSIDTPFAIGDEIQINWTITNAYPQSSGTTVHVVDLFDMQDIEGNSKFNLNTLPQWSNVSEFIGGIHNNWSGKPNTAAIIAQTGHVASGAKLTDDLVRTFGSDVYADWYLPSAAQLTTIYQLRNVLDPKITDQGGDILTKTHTHHQKKSYWGSLESQNSQNNTPVYSVSFNPNSGGGATFGRSKSSRYRTRAVREFILDPADPLPLVGDFLGGGIVYAIITEGSGGLTPTVDLKVSIGSGSTEIFNQTGLNNGFTHTVTHTITETDGTNPSISWLYNNSNADPYNWGTTYQIWKKDNEVVTQIQAGAKTTLAWNDDAARWTSRYSYIPEYMSTYKTGIATFLKGKLYIHDDSQNKNYFYNGFYPTMVTYIDNVSPSQPKVFMNHAVEGDNKPNYTTFETVDNWVMNSDLILEDYIEREGTYYSEMYGDVNDPNVGDNATYGDKLRKGTKLRGQYIKVGMRFDDNNLEVKHSNIGYITSKGHTT